MSENTSMLKQLQQNGINGFPPKSRRFFPGKRFDPPRAGIMARQRFVLDTLKTEGRWSGAIVDQPISDSLSVSWFLLS